MDSGLAPAARPGMTVDDSAQVETALMTDDCLPITATPI
jgi:hypothetical protein